jgi:hypothetical protein
MNSTSPLEGRGDTFERRLLEELTEIDARRPIATSPPARPRRDGQRRPGMLVVAIVAALVVAGGATAAASIVLRPDRPDKVLPCERRPFSGRASGRGSRGWDASLARW